MTPIPAVQAKGGIFIKQCQEASTGGNTNCSSGKTKNVATLCVPIAPPEALWVQWGNLMNDLEK